MLRYTTLAIATTLATTCTAYAAAAAQSEGDTIGTGVFFCIPSQGVPAAASLLTARQQRGGTGDPDVCTGGQVACDSSCIDAGFECCHVGQGQACQDGYSCYSQGCCRHGKTCSGPPRGCTATTKMCDIGCIPRDRVCCGLGDGSSCNPGTVCLASGLCGTPVSNGSASSGRGPEQSPTSAASGVSTTSRRTLPGSAIGESVTPPVEASSGARATATAASPSGPSSAGAASASDKSKPTTESSASSDKGAAGATLKAPAVLAGLLALAAYLI